MSNRLARVNQLIKKELSQIILREVKFLSGVLVTLTRVETISNLNESKVYIGVIPENKTESVFQILNKQIYRLQQELNHRLNMRPVPRIYFAREKETIMAGRVEEILEKLKKEKK